MAKGNRHGMAAVEGSAAEGGAVEGSAVTGNNTVTFRRNHPKNRASYGIAGVSGIIVVDRAMFAEATAPTSDTDRAGLPEVLTLDAAMALPKPDNKAEKEAAKVAKLAEKAVKAQAKIEAAAAKAIEKQAKADAALAAAKAKVEAAAAATKANSPADL